MYIVEYNDESFFDEFELLKSEEIDGSIVRVVTVSRLDKVSTTAKYFVVTLLVNRIGISIPYILKLNVFLGFMDSFSDEETKAKYKPILEKVDSIIAEKGLKKLGGIISL